MKFIKTDNTDTINKQRIKLYQRFTAPLDGMWEALYIGSSQYYRIETEEHNIGYCCIDEKRSLKQIFIENEFNHQMSNVILELIDSKLISSASLSSIEPISFNTCLVHSQSIETNTLCFQLSDKWLQSDSPLDLKLVSEEHTQDIKQFFKTQIGFDDTFGYAENLIRRKEQYAIIESGIIIATGECRFSDSQPDIADLGVIVNKDYQRKGIATQVLQQLAQKAKEANRKPICSTTYDNVASRKAIEKVGFFCSHIIFDIHFTTKAC